MNNTDLIDKYLHNELDHNEKKIVEELLSEENNSTKSLQFKKEFYLQQDLIMAIRARGLKEQLKAQEQKMREKRIKTQRILRISTWSTGTVSLIAAICLLVIILKPTSDIVQDYGICAYKSVSPNTIMQEEGALYMQSISNMVIRGGLGDSYEGQKQRIYSLIIENKIEEANELAISTLAQLESERDSFDLEEYLYHYDEILWIHTNCEMYFGNEISAKILLEQIVNSDSYYAEKAQEILNKL